MLQVVCFFPGGTAGRVLPGGKVLPVPPNWQQSSLFDQTLFDMSFVPENVEKFYLIFLYILTTFQLKTASENSILCLKHQNLLRFCCRGAFLASADNFLKSPLIWLRPQCESPPPHLTLSPVGAKNCPRKQVRGQTQSLVKKLCVCGCYFIKLNQNWPALWTL